MKKLLFLASIGLISCPAFSQNGLYISSSVGAGISNTKNDIEFTNGNSISKVGIPSYEANVNVGYQFKHWRLQTGLQYSTSGYKLKGLLFSSEFDPLDPNPNPVGNSTYQITYKHIGIPLQVGYVLRPEKKLSIIPTVGLLTTYNLGAKSVTTIAGEATNHKWGKDEFDNAYNRISLWGTAAVQFEYKLNKRISLTATPSIQGMVGNLMSKPSDFYFADQQRNYSIHLDLGVKIKL
jgi:hypothetical protein